MAAKHLGLTTKDVEEVLRSKLKTTDFSIVSWDLKPLTDGGKKGYAGEHYRLLCSVCHPSSKSESKCVIFFLKSLPDDSLKRALDLKTGNSRKERLFYELLASKFIELIGEDRGPEFQPFIFPECRLMKENFIVLDFLGPNYKLLDHEKLTDFETVKLVVREMAKLHAASLILEEQSGKRINELFPEIIYESYFNGDPSHPNATWHQTSFKLVVNVIPHLEKYNKDLAKVKRIQEAMPSLMRELFPSMLAWPKERNVLVHGDLWINNLMFRYENGKPVEVCLVDFQLLRYTVPAHDLTTFVMFCTDKAFRDRHMDELIDVYWKSMSVVISKAGHDINAILPKSEFQRTMNEMRKFGLIEMTMEYPFLIVPPYFMDAIMADSVKYHHHCHVDRTEAVIKLYYDDPAFRLRWSEVLEELIDKYILTD